MKQPHLSVNPFPAPDDQSPAFDQKWQRKRRRCYTLIFAIVALIDVVCILPVYFRNAFVSEITVALLSVSVFFSILFFAYRVWNRKKPETLKSYLQTGLWVWGYSLLVCILVMSANIAWSLLTNSLNMYILPMTFVTSFMVIAGVVFLLFLCYFLPGFLLASLLTWYLFEKNAFLSE